MGKIAGLIGVVVAIVLKLSLPWLIAAFSGLPVVALALNTGVLFLRRKRWLRPRLGNVSWLFARKLFQIGSLFFVLQLAVTIAFSSDSIVIAQIRGAEAVAEYAVVKQLFMIVSVGVAMILGPLWPAYGEAFARKDLEWAKRTFIRSLAICVLIASGFSLVMALFGKQILLAWVGDEVVPSRLLFWAFGLWTVVQSINNALAMLLNGAQVVRFQVIIAVLMAMTNLVLSVVLCYGVGISGVVWGSLISTTVLVLIPGMLFVIRMFDERWWHNRDVDWLISER
jgi:O-antigen/teichoic acid export membrane protein